MTQDEIIRMARDTGKTKWFGTHPDGTNDFLGAEFTPEQLERFANLVAAHEREKQPEHFAKAIAELVECCRVLAEENETAVLAEREACAKVCEELGESNRDAFAQYDCAAAIRARGEK